MKQLRILVIGIGRLGDSLVRHLHQDETEVIALDNDPENVDRIKNFSSLALVGDATDLEVLKEIGAASVDQAIISIGDCFEASVMTLTNLLELKVANIAVRASTARQAKIFESIGAHKVFYVEEDMGRILAHRFSRPSILHAMELGYGVKVAEWSPAKWAEGKSLLELQLPQKHRVQVMALRDPRRPKEIIFPAPQTVLEQGISVLLLGSDQDLQRLLERE